MRDFVGRAMLWLVALAVCMSGALAEGGSMFDFGKASPVGDAVQIGWQIENESYCQVYLVKDGQQILVSNFNANTPEDGEYILRLYRLQSGNYFLHTLFFYNGVNQIYRTLAFENGRWQMLQKIEDPAYTDGTGLRDPDTYEESFYTEDMSETADAQIDGILNATFAQEGITFEDKAPTVPGEQILEMTGAEILSQAENPITAEAAPAQEAQAGGGLLQQALEAPAPSQPSGHVRASGGSINVRSGPGLSYSTVGSVSQGTVFDYLGEISTDGRGVDWYKVSYRDSEAWVSSRYATLEN